MERNQSYLAIPYSVPAEDPWADVVGTGCVGLAALLFGLAATCAKWVDINPLFFMVVRGPIEWALSAATLLVVWRSREGTGLPALAFGASGNRRGRAVVALRSLTMWATNVLTILSFTLLPVGDAAAIIFTFGPAFNGVFAFLLLGEPLILRTWLLFLVNAGGTLLVVRPAALFGSTFAAAERDNPAAYWQGVAVTVGATVFSGLRPVLTRSVRSWHWSAVAHAACATSIWLLTPLALAAFYAADRSAFAAAAAELACVFKGPTGCPAGARAHGGTAGDDGLPLSPRPGASAALLVAPLLSVTANLLNVYAYQSVTHSHTANMLAYVEIPFAFALQHFLFGERVDALDAVGILVILASAATSACLSAREAARRSASSVDLDGLASIEGGERSPTAVNNLAADEKNKPLLAFLP